MKKYNKIGFIGCGKIAGAIIKGIIGSGFTSKSNVIASKSSKENLDAISQGLGIEITLDNKVVAKNSEVIFLAVKPSQAEAVLKEIKELITPEKLVVSVLAGVTTGFIESLIGTDARVIRVMPNTPVLVGEGMSGICRGSNISFEDIDYVKKLFETIGKCIEVEESQIDVVTAISGSGPAFFYKIINDIARSGEKLGLEYEKSLLLSIQTALGSAKMSLQRNISMEDLISNVATKGGCTRVGVDVMEDSGIENILYEVVKNTAIKAGQLGK